MAKIHLLDSETIDKIAAGEVVERPASVVKELVENSLDAGSTAVTVEIRGGGIEFIRVTDNGDGMEREQIRTAFLRHATSKIEHVDDLMKIHSLGFRGEALSSISSVSKVELITKTKDTLTGTRILLEGGREDAFEDVGAPDGTTFLVKNLFYNTPVRRKFLKQPATEGGYIIDLMEHLALSRPDVSFKLIVNSALKFHTSGNGDLKEVIYRIYGKETARELIPIDMEREGIKLQGYLGKPTLVRPNRNHEIYFINGRFIRSNVIARAIEEGYKEYLMQHKFPFCVLHFSMDTGRVDVNVHPTKMDVRFTDAMTFSAYVCGFIKYSLLNREMIPEATLLSDKEKAEEKKAQEILMPKKAPESFEQNRDRQYRLQEEMRYRKEMGKTEEEIPRASWKQPVTPPPMSTDYIHGPAAGVKRENYVKPVIPRQQPEKEETFFSETSEIDNRPKQSMEQQAIISGKNEEKIPDTVAKTEPVESPVVVEKPTQMSLFEDKILTEANRKQFRIVGQVFETYWLIEFDQKLLMIDQHAAHEKVNYERMMKRYREKTILSQTLLPPVIVSLSGREEIILNENLDAFAELGFEIENFGGNEYALRSVPVDLYGCDEKSMFLEVLQNLLDGSGFGSLRVIEEKIASMACKASVKGNQLISLAEAEVLIDELLTLENPYNCPHGRPTIVTISKAEMEKKFKRIV